MARLTVVPDGPSQLPPTPDLTAGQRRTLEACLHVFAEMGYGASIRDIAAAASTTSANLYNHFATKEAMLAELAKLGNEEYLRRVTVAVLAAGPAPADQLAAVVRAHVLVHCELPLLARVLNGDLERMSEEVAAPTRLLRAQALLLVREILHRGVADGSFDVVAEAPTITALAALGVDAARWFPGQTDVTADELADVYVALALRMVGSA